MANIIKWVQKSKNNGLRPGEEIQVAVSARESNSTAFAAGLISGITAKLLLKRQSGTDLSQSALSMQHYPHGSVILALTQSRLLVYRLNFLGRPKALAVSYEKHELAKAEIENKGIYDSLTLTFADGGAVSHDVGIVQDGALKKLIELINPTLT